jgi:glycosyltransferase involved in cell wall biosynthesis
MATTLCVFEKIPNYFHGGGDLTALCIMESLLEEGHHLHLALLGVDPNHLSPIQKQALKSFQNKGITFDLVHNHSKALNISNEMQKRFPGFLFQHELSQIVDKQKPQKILAYHWVAAASCYGLPVLKGALVGDPAHLPLLFRRRLDKSIYGSKISLKESLKDCVNEYYLKRAMKIVLNDFDQCGAFAAHHAIDLEHIGVKKCLYMRTPMEDPFALRPKIQELKKTSNKLQILHIGHLRGTATLSGVKLMMEEVYPVLNQTIGVNHFELNIVGGFFDELPSSLKKLFAQPNINVLGHIVPPDEQFFTSDITFVPIPVELGIRVRIITALAYGALVVAHSANKKGIPELEDEKNCLLGSTPKELAEKIQRVAEGKVDVKTLRQNARRTFEKAFSIQSAGKQISDLVAKLT